MRARTVGLGAAGGLLVAAGAGGAFAYQAATTADAADPNGLMVVCEIGGKRRCWQGGERVQRPEPDAACDATGVADAIWHSAPGPTLDQGQLLICSDREPSE